MITAEDWSGGMKRGLGQGPNVQRKATQGTGHRVRSDERWQLRNRLWPDVRF